MVDAQAFRADLPVFRWVGRTGAERRWLAELPGLVAEFERRWQVRTGPPFMSGTSSWAAPGVTADGTPVVLKIARRYRLFADLVGEPVDRLLAWSLARNVEGALWYVSRADLPAATTDIALATTLAQAATGVSG
jgi:hypothetical protein